MSDTPQIFPAMARVLEALPAIGKDRHNSAQGFQFRGIDDVLDALNPILGKEGVFFVPTVEVATYAEEIRNGRPWTRCQIRVRYTFFAADGSHVSAVGQGEALDNADKATSKAMSMALKYVLFQTFAIATQDTEDPDASTPPEQDAPAPPMNPPAKKAAAKAAPRHKQTEEEQETAKFLKAEANKLAGTGLAALKKAMADGGLPTNPDYMNAAQLEQWDKLIQRLLAVTAEAAQVHAEGEV